jgi:hypothetical protein
MAHHWYIGYDLDEPVPDHSSSSKIRDRYSLGVFQQFFEQIVEECIDAGLVWGEELYFDSAKSKSGRHIFRSFHQEYVERVKKYHQIEEYRKAMKKRGHWIEPLFGEAKDFHRLGCFRLRGLLNVNIEGVMIAAKTKPEEVSQVHLG